MYRDLRSGKRYSREELNEWGACRFHTPVSVVRTQQYHFVKDLQPLLDFKQPIVAQLRDIQKQHPEFGPWIEQIKARIARDLYLVDGTYSELMREAERLRVSKQGIFRHTMRESQFIQTIPSMLSLGRPESTASEKGEPYNNACDPQWVPDQRNASYITDRKGREPTHDRGLIQPFPLVAPSKREWRCCGLPYVAGDSNGCWIDYPRPGATGPVPYRIFNGIPRDPSLDDLEAWLDSTTMDEQRSYRGTAWLDREYFDGIHEQIRADRETTAVTLWKIANGREVTTAELNRAAMVYGLIDRYNDPQRPEGPEAPRFLGGDPEAWLSFLATKSFEVMKTASVRITIESDLVTTPVRNPKRDAEPFQPIPLPLQLIVRGQERRWVLPDMQPLAPEPTPQQDYLERQRREEEERRLKVERERKAVEALEQKRLAAQREKAEEEKRLKAERERKAAEALEQAELAAKKKREEEEAERRRMKVARERKAKDAREQERLAAKKKREEEEEEERRLKDEQERKAAEALQQAELAARKKREEEAEKRLLKAEQEQREVEEAQRKKEKEETERQRVLQEQERQKAKEALKQQELAARKKREEEAAEAERQRQEEMAKKTLLTTIDLGKGKEEEYSIEDQILALVADEDLQQFFAFAKQNERAREIADAFKDDFTELIANDNSEGLQDRSIALKRDIEPLKPEYPPDLIPLSAAALRFELNPNLARGKRSIRSAELTMRGFVAYAKRVDADDEVTEDINLLLNQFQHLMVRRGILALSQDEKQREELAEDLDKQSKQLIERGSDITRELRDKFPKIEPIDDYELKWILANRGNRIPIDKRERLRWVIENHWTLRRWFAQFSTTETMQNIVKSMADGYELLRNSSATPNLKLIERTLDMAIRDGKEARFHLETRKETEPVDVDTWIAMLVGYQN